MIESGPGKQSILIKEYIKENLTDNNLKARIKDLSKHTPILEIMIRTENIMKSLHTEPAKRIARKRIEFMKEFIKKLKEEGSINCESFE